MKLDIAETLEVITMINELIPRIKDIKTQAKAYKRDQTHINMLTLSKISIEKLSHASRELESGINAPLKLVTTLLLSEE